MKQLTQARVHLSAVDDCAQAVVFVNAPVFANAQEYDAVDGLLHGTVQLTLRELRVAQGDAAGKQLAPRFDLFEKRGINLSRAFFAFAGFSVFIKRALQNRLARKDGLDFIPALRIFADSLYRACGLWRIYRS